MNKVFNLRFLGLFLVFVIVFTGCEAGLQSNSSSSGDDSDEFSFSDMYSKISELQTRLNSVNQTLAALTDDQLDSAASLGSRVSANEANISQLLATASPIGTIVPFAGSSIPPGWHLCDGTSVERTGEYNALFTVISTTWGFADSSHFNLPNLQGRFLRGVDNAENVDPEDRYNRYAGGNTNGIGSYQYDAFQDHYHQWSYTDSASGGESYNTWDWDGDGTLQSVTNDTSNSKGGNASTETRPENAAVNYMIKYQ
ncbi:MAG: tail fiber protein [bacterium]|nr:tail fiber protein [bacterium]